jgi:hypothetical protein
LDKHPGPFSGKSVGLVPLLQVTARTSLQTFWAVVIMITDIEKSLFVAYPNEVFITVWGSCQQFSGAKGNYLTGGFPGILI